MQDLYLFEAGSTKTDVWYSYKGKEDHLQLPGFNPNREHSTFLTALKDLDIPSDAKIVFYGAGLSHEANKDYVRNLFKKSQIKVFDDVLGAARAVYGDSKGVIALMGTGGLAAYFDGEAIVKRRGGYGYLIDDLGGGFELGKAILSAWLNDDLASATSKHLETKLNVQPSGIVKQIYEQQDLALISSLPIVVKELEDEALRGVYHDYFDQFIKRNVLPICIEFQQHSFAAVGSIGSAFSDVINAVSENYDLKVKQLSKAPSEALFRYHLTHS